MNVQVTLEVPDGIVQRAREMAAKTGRRMEDVLVAWVEHGWRLAPPDFDEAPVRAVGHLTYDEWIAGIKQSLKDRGATGEPIGAEALQKMMIEGGVDPNDNSFSRGIIEMREE